VAPGRASVSIAGARAIPAPALVLWAWERPEDLRGLGTSAGVAFLAQSITIDGQIVTRVPRRQPLRVDPSTPLIAVTRIQTAAPVRALNDDIVGDVAGAIGRTAALP